MTKSALDEVLDKIAEEHPLYPDRVTRREVPMDEELRQRLAALDAEYKERHEKLLAELKSMDAVAGVDEGAGERDRVAEVDLT